jgi:hypothetical protein
LTANKQNLGRISNVNMYGPAYRRAFYFQRLQNLMPLNLDTEIVATAYDPSTDSCGYTIERNGKRWTVQVQLAQLDACGANKQARRDYLGNVLLAAMDGPPDGATPDAGVTT